MEKVKEYYPYMDGVKGFAILLMVMAHGIAWSYPNTDFLFQRFTDMNQNEFNAAFLCKLIYSFHMPLLFVVSGFLFYKPIQYNWKSIKSILRKRVTRILIPYLATGWLVLFLKGYFGYWFLLLLFLVNILVVIEFFIIESIKIPEKYHILFHMLTFAFLFVFCKIIGHYTLPKALININGLCVYYLAFILGVILRKHKTFLEMCSNKWVSFACFSVFILLFALSNIQTRIPFLGMLIPIVASIYFIGTFKQMDSQSFIWGGIMWVGKNSLEIYILHLFFVMPISEMGNYIFHQYNFALSLTIQLVYSIVISIIAIFFSLLTSTLLKENTIISKLLFGC